MIIKFFIFAAAFAACLADVAVIMGGESDNLLSANVDTVETYSTKCGKIFQSKIPPLPKARRQAAAAYLDGKIYICGGYSALVDIKTCYMLDLTQETYEWVESAPLINGRFKFQMVVSGSKIYAVGGEGAFSAHDNIEVYDPSTNTWTAGPNLTGYHQSFCSVGTADSIYVAGGFSSGSFKRLLERLDLATGEWTRLSDMPVNKTSHACALYKTGFVAAGGWTGTGEEIGDTFPTSRNDFYDFETDTWTLFDGMSHRRTEHAMANVDGNLLVFGGYQKAHLDTYEVYNTTVVDDEYWDYGSDRLAEAKSSMAIVVVPSQFFEEC